MQRDRTRIASLVIGLLAAVAGFGYLLTVHPIGVPEPDGVPAPQFIVGVSFLVVPFALAAGAAYLALNHRVVLPVLIAGLAAIAAILDWGADGVLFAAVAAGQLAVVVAFVELLVRNRAGELANPPSAAAYRAISIGAMGAVLYFGAFTIRAVLPLWRSDAAVLGALSETAGLVFLLVFVLGSALVLVAPPIALNRGLGVQAPVVALVAYLLVDLAFVQPAIASGTQLLHLQFLAIWPMLAVLLTGVGLLEWWVRDRRGEYDEPKETDEGGDEEGLSVEGGLFGDKV